MRGYKVFNEDWTCRDFQYEVGKEYVYDGEIELCGSGFHFCEKLANCFNYCGFNPSNKVAEVEAVGEVINGEDKSVTDKITIIKELSWEEVLKMCNTGNRNTGNRNTGNRNTGDWNTGDWNTGNRNTGDWNTGDWNTGDWNTGDWNTGNRNTGDWNTGDWNSCNNSTGIFNTEEEKIRIFDQTSNMTILQWRQSKACKILDKVALNEWIYESDMTDEEKEENPSYKVTEGYLKTRSLYEACEKWWNEISQEEKDIVISIPNFDKDKFKKITGIDVDKNL